MIGLLGLRRNLVGISYKKERTISKDNTKMGKIDYLFLIGFVLHRYGMIECSAVDCLHLTLVGGKWGLQTVMALSSRSG